MVTLLQHPLLFLIYINDLPNPSKLLNFFLFADDTNVYFESDDPIRLSKTINKELKKVKSWLDCNKLALNIEKTNFSLFRLPRKKLPNLINIKFGKSSIKKTKYVKFLGFLVDEHLSWKYHINELYKYYLEQQLSFSTQTLHPHSNSHLFLRFTLLFFSQLW